MKPISAVLSARSEVIEARMDGRVAEMKGDIRALIVRMDERDARNEETFSVIRKQLIGLTSWKQEISWILQRMHA